MTEMLSPVGGNTEQSMVVITLTPLAGEWKSLYSKLIFTWFETYCSLSWRYPVAAKLSIIMEGPNHILLLTWCFSVFMHVFVC